MRNHGLWYEQPDIAPLQECVPKSPDLTHIQIVKRQRGLLAESRESKIHLFRQAETSSVNRVTLNQSRLTGHL